MELAILEFIQSIRFPLLDAFFVMYTHLGDLAQIWFFIMIVTALKKETRPIALMAFIALIVEVLTVDISLKPIFMRARPFETYPHDILIGIPHGSSFPSGHSGSSFAVAGVYLFTKHRMRFIILGLATLMAFSRLYLFVHYPSDVLVGAAIGLLIARIIVKFGEKPLKNMLQNQTKFHKDFLK